MKILHPMRQILLLAGLLTLSVFSVQSAESSTSTNLPAWLTQPLSLADCLNLVEQQNGALLKAKKDLEAAYGIVIQTRAILIPKVQVKSDYQIIDQNSIDRIPFPDTLPGGSAPFSISYPDQRWSASVQLVQSLYEGGRMSSAVRTARLTREQA